MSCTICWRPVASTRQRFEHGTSNSLNALKEVFGPAVSQADVRALRAMAIATSNEFYAEVADIVEKFGAIEFWGEF